VICQEKIFDLPRKKTHIFEIMIKLPLILNIVSHISDGFTMTLLNVRQNFSKIAEVTPYMVCNC